MKRNSRTMYAFRELLVGVKQLPKLFELASEQRAEPQFCSRHRRSLTVIAGGYKVRKIMNPYL